MCFFFSPVFFFTFLLKLYFTGVGRMRVASCELRVASCELRVASCELRVASCELRVASCELRVASCELRIASCQMPVAMENSADSSSGIYTAFSNVGQVIVVFLQGSQLNLSPGSQSKWKQ